MVASRKKTISRRDGREPPRRPIVMLLIHVPGNRLVDPLTAWVVARLWVPSGCLRSVFSEVDDKNLRPY